VTSRRGGDVTVSVTSYNYGAGSSYALGQSISSITNVYEDYISSSRHIDRTSTRNIYQFADGAL